MEENGTESKHNKWNELIQSRLGITERSKQVFEMDKLIQFVSLLKELEEENLKLNSKSK